MIINKYLKRLESLQETTGAFASTTIPCQEKIITTYYTAVILISLRHIADHPTVQKISKRAILFLKNEMQKNTQWNYLAIDTSSPYPNDLDDTALCHLAISTYEPSWLTPKLASGIVQTLISNEKETGGPYFTWITRSHSKPWDTIDLVVNINILRCLEYWSIESLVLEKFITNALSIDDLTSDFYHDALFIGYFLSSIRSESVRSVFKNYLQKNLFFLKEDSIIQKTLSSIILKNLNICPEKHSRLHGGIVCDSDTYQVNNYSFFIDKITPTEIQTSTCEAFEIALIIESLSYPACETVSHHDNSIIIIPEDTTSCVISLFIKHCQLPPLSQSAIIDEIIRLAASPIWNNLFITQSFYESLTTLFSSSISRETVDILCLATVLGWIGFSLQDDIFDCETSVYKIPLAQSCILETQRLIINTLQDQLHSKKCLRLLTLMNESLLIESITMRVPIENKILSLEFINFDSLFSYDLSQKSIGYALGPVALSLMVKRDPLDNSHELVLLFFQKLLTVKQSLDDHHDWYDDLLRGHITPLGARILYLYSQKFPTDSIIDIHDKKIVLYNYFWKNIFHETFQEMSDLLSSASHLISEFDILENKDFLYKQIQYYQKQLENISKQYQETTEFIREYEKMRI